MVTPCGEIEQRELGNSFGFYAGHFEKNEQPPAAEKTAT
jgi:hypothetical protein